jgi:hypothetical protein
MAPFAALGSSHYFLFGLVLVAGLSCQRAAATPENGQRVVSFEGTCDASSAVELGRSRALVADDENNLLRIYDVERGGKAVVEIDVSASLGLDQPSGAESDLEGATRVGERAYFLSSHARTSKGKRDPDRLLFFATELPSDSGGLKVLGTSRSLLENLMDEPRLARFGLRAASSLAPKEPGGLNLEGLTVRAEGGLWLGFRNPVPEGRALLVGLLNPEEVIEGKKAQFSEPLLLDLGGLGVRALSRWKSTTLILAGPSGDGGPFKLFRLKGASTAEPLAVDLSGIGAEAIFADDSRDEVLVLSDDGTREVAGKACKKLKDPRKKSFRGVWVSVPE